MNNLFDIPVYIVSGNTQRDRNKMIYAINLFIRMVCVWDFWEDPQCRWYLKPAGNNEFYIVTSNTQREGNLMLFLNYNGGCELWPYWEDNKCRWKWVSNNNETGWLISTNTSRKSNCMLYLDNGLRSWPFWEDDKCLWKIIPAVNSVVKDVEFLLNTANIIYTTPICGSKHMYTNDTSIIQSITWPFEYTEENTSTFEITHGCDLGLNTEIITNIPLLSDGKINIEKGECDRFISSQTKTKKNTRIIEVPIVVPPGKIIEGTLTYNKQNISISWNGKLYWEGTNKTHPVLGIWKGVVTNFMNVQTKELK